MFSRMVSAESEVFTSSGVHRKIALFVDSSQRFKREDNLAEQSARLRDAVKNQKAVGGLSYAKALSALACCLIDGEHYDEAEPLCREALAIRKAELPKNDSDLAAAMHNLGALYDLRHQPGDDAEASYFSSLKVVSDFAPSEFRAYVTQNLGEYEYAKNKLPLAEGMFRYSLKDHDALSSKPTPALSEVLESLSRCLEKEGKQDEATPYIQRYEKMNKQD